MSDDFTWIMVERHLALREAWLREHAGEAAPYQVDPRQAVVFTWLPQDLGDRTTTRLGGAPYWPAAWPWPTCPTCLQPLALWGQLDCRHPLKRPGLPGDLLTWHHCPCRGDWESREAAFEGDLSQLPPPPEGCGYVPARTLLTWHLVDSSAALWPADALPETPQANYAPGPWYGTPRVVTEWPTLSDELKYDEEALYAAITLEATKLGGWPKSPQHAEVPTNAAGIPLRFLGQFGPVQAHQDATLEPRGQFTDDRDFMWGDMGSVFFFVDPATGQVDWWGDSY